MTQDQYHQEPGLRQSTEFAPMFSPEDIEERKQACQACGGTYAARWIRLAKVFRDVTVGRCLECRDKWRREWELEQVRLEKLARQAEAAHERVRYRQTCGIQERFQNADFTSFDRKRPGNVGKIWQACWDYAEGFPIENRPQYPSLLLYGSNGLGKTHLACAIGHRVLDRWQGEPHRQMLKYISESDLLNSIQASYGYTEDEKKYRRSEDQIIGECIGVPLLILDDVAKEERTNMLYTRRTLFRLIDARYSRGLPVVVATNLELPQLEAYLSYSSTETGTYERLIEMCQGKGQKLTGESYRRNRRTTN